MSALRNAASVLRCFSPEEPELSVSLVTERLGLPRSTASWLMKTMAEEGLLEVSAATRRYRPGPVVISSGQLFRATSTLIASTDELVSSVAADAGHTGYVSVLDGIDVFAIRMHAGSHALRVVTPIGVRFPAYATAVGRSLLARYPDDRVRELFSGPLQAVSVRAPRSVEDLLARLGAVRRHGFAEADDEANRGVGTVAVSIADTAAQETVSACITFSLSIVSAEERAAIRDALMAGAANIGRRFNDPFWTPRLGPAQARSTAA